MTPQHVGESNKDVLKSPHRVTVASSSSQLVNRIYSTAKTCQNHVKINLIKNYTRRNSRKPWYNPWELSLTHVAMHIQKDFGIQRSLGLPGNKRRVAVQTWKLSVTQWKRRGQDRGEGGLEDECIFVYAPVQTAWVPGRGKRRLVYQPRQKKGLATEMSFNFYYECPKWQYTAGGVLQITFQGTTDKEFQAL